MKKIIILLIIFLIFGFSFTVGYYVYTVKFTNQEIAKENLEREAITIEQISAEYNKNIENTVIETNVSEEKVSPKASIVIKKYYKGCGHITKDYATIPEEVVNKNRKRSERNVSRLGITRVFSK